MSRATRYAPELRERAVRIVFEHQGEYGSQWATMQSIAPKFGCTLETLRSWVCQAKTDQGIRDGMSTSSVQYFLIQPTTRAQPESN